MSTPRGTKRAQRRAEAQRVAEVHGITPKEFPRFWRYGATTDAAQAIIKLRAKGEAVRP